MSTQIKLSDDRLDYSLEELLASGDFAEPLIAGGVRCHGGFDADGVYGSPRVLHRKPAIQAWQRALQAQGHELLEISSDLMPPQYPSVDQAVLLCRNGVREPVVRALTIISVVEGFGAIIRGHGGVRDRFDGFLFALPGAYYLMLVLEPWAG